MAASPFPVPPDSPSPDDVVELIDELRAARNGPQSVDEAVELLVDVSHSDLDERPTARPYRWRIESRNDAEWAAQMLTEAEHAVADVERQYQEWIEPFMTWRLEQLRDPDIKARFFRAHLARFALDERERTGQATLKVPSAVVRTTRTEAHATIPKDGQWKSDAERALLAWAIEHDHLEIVNPGVYLKELAKVGKPVVVVTFGMDCEHQDSVTLDAELWTPRMFVVGGQVLCSTCRRPAIIDSVTSHHEVHDDTNQVIPGAIVDPTHVSASVSITRKP